MPPVEEILRILKFITVRFKAISISWHLVIYIFVLLSSFSIIRLKRKMLACLLVLPLASVAIVSYAAGSPFNAIIFTLISLVLFISCFRIGSGSSTDKPIWVKVSAIVFILCGLFYPHFSDNYYWLFLTAPMGLIPCPTLLLVSGFTLLFGPFSRMWMITLILAVLFYSLFGVFRLKVYIDLILFGALISLGHQLWQFHNSGMSGSRQKVKFQ